MKPQASVLLALLAVPFLPALACACSCLYGGPFSKVAPEAHLVIIGDVVSHHGNSMQVDIVRVLKGDETRKRLTVWGDNGMQCRPHMDQLPESFWGGIVVVGLACAYAAGMAAARR